MKRAEISWKFGGGGRPLRHISTQVIPVTWVFCFLADLSCAQWLCVPRPRAQPRPRGAPVDVLSMKPLEVCTC